MDGELEISDGEIIFLGRRRCSEDDVVVGLQRAPNQKGGCERFGSNIQHVPTAALEAIYEGLLEV
jgi:hypothetical protein